MEARDRELILEFKSRLAPSIKKRLRKVIVFGSRARGEAMEDSDLDVVALVDRKTPQVEKELEDTAYQVMWDHDFRPIISLKVFDESRFYNAVKRSLSFYSHVEKEGVSV
ncbi:MAG: nucleotidyltransferase domain-containing protein [Actinobacteria bacterium]|nr:nucleotidyltransferase domain-containing protein [Actinomycetota bacterium]